MYDYNDSEVYNTNIILEILKFIDINTCIEVENFNYVTMFEIDSDENEKDCVFFDVRYNEKMFEKVINECYKKFCDEIKYTV